MTNHSNLKLGKRPRRHDSRTLKLARYVKSALPPAPPCVDYTRGITDWGMMLNDSLGCCTIAAVGHAVQIWTANAASAEVSFPDPVILDYYQTWDGYNPADPATDQGGVELDVLNDWRQQGFAGQSLDAYAAIDLEQGPHPVIPVMSVMDAIWLFSGAYIGLELPISAQTQDVWDVSANPGPEDEPGSWGGHAVYLVGYEAPVTTPALSAPPLLNQEGSFAGPSPVSRVSDFWSPMDSIGVQRSDPCPGSLTCITWGQLKKMTWPWFAKYCSEAYALVSKDWIEACGVSPSGLDLATLEDDLKLVTG